MSNNETHNGLSLPIVLWTHRNGPTLICSDGVEHILSMIQRLGIGSAVISINKLDEQLVAARRQQLVVNEADAVFNQYCPKWPRCGCPHVYECIDSKSKPTSNVDDDCCC